MVREYAAPLLLLPVAGCSLLLDFSDGAIPLDGPAGAPYSQAECDYKEPNDSLATAARITPADTGPAAICAGAVEDHDFYRFTVPDGATQVDIRMDYSFGPGRDLDLRLYDGTGTELTKSVGFGNEERISCPGAAPACPMLAAGDYVFEVFPVPGSVNRYTIALSITP